MNYDDIKTLALEYSDREDDEVADNFQNFIQVVEARVNRSLRVGNMTFRATIDLSDPDIQNAEYFGLPFNFGGLRDIEIVNGDSRKTMQYLSPEQMNQRITAKGHASTYFYTLIAQQIHIYPTFDVGTMELVYYQKLIPLSEQIASNWLSETNPDAYIFGVLVEISAFVKDKESADIWNARFKETIADIISEDSVDRWSGTTLMTRVG
jgi:hypothetical protein